MTSCKHDSKRDSSIIPPSLKLREMAQIFGNGAIARRVAMPLCKAARRRHVALYKLGAGAGAVGETSPAHTPEHQVFLNCHKLRLSKALYSIMG